MEFITDTIGTLFKWIFLIILKVFDIVFAPFIAIITALFPDISSLFYGVIDFLTTYIVPYIKFFLSFLYNLTGLNPGLISILMTYILFLVSARYIMIAINFAFNVYYKLKP